MLYTLGREVQFSFSEFVSEWFDLKYGSIYFAYFKFQFFLSSHLKCDRLKMQVADHLDHLHYLHDILCLKIDKLNVILTDHLLNRLLIPLYVYSLPSHGLDDSVSKVL